MNLEKKIIKKISNLIIQNNATNRTEIAVQLNKIESENIWLKIISEDIEYVHQGEKEWSWFYDKHKNDCFTEQKELDKTLTAVYKLFQ